MIDARADLSYPRISMCPNLLADRLEMLLVAQWLDAGAPEDGQFSFVIISAAKELGCSDGRTGMLEIMGALGLLEETHRIRIEWSPTAGAPATVRLADALRRDAQRVFCPPTS